MSYEIFNLAKTWGGGHKISDMTPIQAIGWEKFICEYKL
jgi:hypothetical protein